MGISLFWPIEGSKVRACVQGKSVHRPWLALLIMVTATSHAQLAKSEIAPKDKKSPHLTGNSGFLYTMLGLW